MAWKASAPAEVLLTKLFAGRAASELWFDWDLLPAGHARGGAAVAACPAGPCLPRSAACARAEAAGVEVPLDEGFAHRVALSEKSFALAVAEPKKRRHAAAAAVRDAHRRRDPRGWPRTPCGCLLGRLRSGGAPHLARCPRRFGAASVPPALAADSAHSIRRNPASFSSYHDQWPGSGVTLLVPLLFLKLLETRAGATFFVVAFSSTSSLWPTFSTSQSIPIGGLMLLSHRASVHYDPHSSGSARRCGPSSTI